MRTNFLNGLLALTAALSCSLSLPAKPPQSTYGMPGLYVVPTDGFEINVMAALQKTGVPVQVVTDEKQAKYVLELGAIAIHKESGIGKVARCAFAYCAGIADSGEVTVRMLDRDNGGQVVWAYEVAKQRAVKNRQSMAEAIAKHLRKDVFP